MKVSAERELQIAIAAIIIDHVRGDGLVTCIESLGYSRNSQVVIVAAHVIRDLFAAGNDPEILFADQVRELTEMSEDGRVEEYRIAVEAKTKVGRNSPCYCGSGKKYKKCCYAANVPVRTDTAAEFLKSALEQIDKDLGLGGIDPKDVN